MLFEHGLDKDTISDIVGHESSEVTQTYYLQHSTYRISKSIEKAFGKNFLRQA